MTRTRPSLSSVHGPAVLFAVLLAAGGNAAQQDRPQDPAGQLGQTEDSGFGREQMWYAPTEEDWAKPVQIEFQRTWEDAVAVAQETGKPILICVNMDGEIASEHYAGIRYRQPEVGELYDDYVCVIASVYRHTPRDYDANGERVLCPRFGSVTCGEHIRIEPILYERFFDGRRIAPRHIMVELDGSEVYDVYYAFDTASVFSAIAEGIAERAAQPSPEVRGDQTIFERVASRDRADREAVERAYREGDRETRRELLEAAAQHMDKAPADLLRLAVFGLDTELARVARDALSEAQSTKAVDLINEALRAPLEQSERETLIAALERLGEQSVKARTFAAVQRGLGAESRDVDAARWSAAMQGQEYPAPDSRDELEAALDGAAATSDESAGPDPAAELRAAIASLKLAVDPETRGSLARDQRTAQRYLQLMFEDARRGAQRAADLGAEGWRVGATLALADYYLGERRAAYERIAGVVGGIEAGDPSWEAMASLALFAEARQRAIWRRLRAQEDWPKEWLTDVNSAYEVIAEHPFGTADHAVFHHDFLNSLGGGGAAWRVLNRALRRFPSNARLHDRLRAHVLDERGVEGLEQVYASLLRRAADQPEAVRADLQWFAGYAAIVDAEFRRRQGDGAAARAAYERAIERFDAAIALQPELEATADHFVAISLGGQARLALERGDLETAVARVLASFARHEPAANALDGLNLSTIDTARMLRSRLRDAERDELAARVDAALAALDPELLEPPAYETGGAPSPDAQRARRRRR